MFRAGRWCTPSSDSSNDKIKEQIENIVQIEKDIAQEEEI